MLWRFIRRKNPVSRLLQRHFSPHQLEEIVTACRTFPVTARVDLQRALAVGPKHVGL
jgi:hypothetical protein